MRVVAYVVIGLLVWGLLSMLVGVLLQGKGRD